MKTVILSIAYIVIAFVLLVLMDVGLYYMMNNVLFKAFNWFNTFNFWFKLFLILIGGTALFTSLVNVSTILASRIGGLIIDKLPENAFTIYGSLILSLLNTVYNLILIWRIPEHYSFWIVIELLFTSGLIWQLTFIVIPLKYQVRHKDPY